MATLSQSPKYVSTSLPASPTTSKNAEEVLPFVTLPPTPSDEDSEDRQVWVGIDEETHKEKLMQTVRALRSLETGADVCLVASDGKHFLVHSFVVSALSPVLRQFLACRADRCLFKVKLVEVSSDALTDILDFMYGCELVLSPPAIGRLLHAARCLGISALDHPHLRQLQGTVRSGDGGSCTTIIDDEIEMLDMPAATVLSSKSTSLESMLQDAWVCDDQRKEGSREASQEPPQAVNDEEAEEKPQDSRNQTVAKEEEHQGKRNKTQKTDRVKQCRRSPRISPKDTTGRD